MTMSSIKTITYAPSYHTKMVYGIAKLPARSPGFAELQREKFRGVFGMGVFR